MDIGSEISEKIQLAIKAKLIEINAYVDDELPDYIMIMIANRKPEEQMADALSLFLADNAKSFTKWLYELLSTLRKKPTEKTDDKTSIEKEAKVKSDGSEDASVTAHTEMISPITPKASRWDVKQRRKTSSQSEENHDKIVNVTRDTTASKEAVIDILPEKDDFFDDELLEEVEQVSSKKTAKPSVEKEKTIKKVVAPIVKHITSTIRETSKSSLVKKKTSSKSPERKESRDPSSTGEQAKKSSSLQKRSVAVKSKESSRKVSTTDKEFRSQFAPPKSKKKKLKRSRERESPLSQKENIKTSQKRVREWDKDKGRLPLKYNDPEPLRKSSRSDKNERVSVKSKVSSLVSSTVTIVKTPDYESDDSDGGPVQASVISKVALPKRRSRVPPSKQANRSLLLKAVSEAESSIKKHILANKIIEPISEEVFKSRVEQHKRIAVGNVLEKNKPKDIEISRRNVSSRLLRETNLLKSAAPVDVTPVEDVRRKLIRKRKLSAADAGKLHRQPEESEVDAHDPSLQVIGDSRRIISRDKSVVEESKKEVTLVSLGEKIYKPRFDSRKLTLKTTTKQVKRMHKGDVEERTNETTHSDEQESTEEVPSVKRSKKKRSPSPCFIVTLDGSTTQKDTKVDNSQLERKKKQPVIAKKNSNNDKVNVKNKTAKLDETVAAAKTVEQPENATIEKRKSAGDEANLSDRELANMREKLLAMQEQAKKLKEIQTKQQEILQQKLNNGQTIAKSNNRIIHIANVHFSATENQLSEHFSICGAVSKVTILRDPFSGHPKG